MLYIKEYNEDRIEKLKFIDTEIHRLMNLIFTMTEEEEKDLLRMKISELMDERDALRDKEGNLPPSTIQKAQPIKDTGFSEILPPLPVSNTYKSYYGYVYKRSRKQLLDDTPLFESRKSKAQNNNINNNINNLEDCLQEVFDKFNITKLNRHQGEYYPDANDSKKTQLYYCIGRYSDEYGDVDNYGILIGYGKDELTEVKKSIISKRKLIESRLESEVYIGTPPNTDYLLIRLI